MHVLGVYEKVDLAKEDVELARQGVVVEQGYFIVDSGKSLLEARLFESIEKGEFRPHFSLTSAVRELGDFVQVYQGDERFLDVRNARVTHFRAPNYTELRKVVPGDTRP